MIARWCFLVLLLQANLIYAQIDRTYFGALSDEDQFKYADEYFIKHWFDFYDPKKSSAALSDYAIMQAEAKDPKTICLLKFFWFRNRLDGRLWHTDSAEVRTSLAYLNSILTYTHDHQPELVVEEAICRLAWCMAMLAHKSRMDSRTRRILVYDGAIQSLKTLESQPLSLLHNYHGAAFDIDYHLQWMSTYFFRLEEYDLAWRMSMLGNRVAHPVLTTKEGHERGFYHYKWISSINLGSYYLRMGQLSEAMRWYKKAYYLGKKQPMLIREAVAEGYMGVVQHKQGQSASAIPHLERAITVSRQVNDYESEYNAIVPLADVYLTLRQYGKALPVLQRAVALYDSQKYNQILGPTDSTETVPLFAGLGEVYKYRGDLKIALFYTQLANRLEAKRRQNDDSRRFRQKQEKLEAEAYRAKLNQIEADRSRALWLRNASVISLGLVLLFSLLYLHYQRLRRREAERQLALITQEARTRTEQLTQLQQANIETPAPASATDETLPHLAELMELAILTEADWERFRKLFEQVYPNYLLRLRRKHTMLTPAETRIICLSRLSLSTKEMADMLGVSADTIVKTRYRIRKKANLPEGTDLAEAFANV